MSDTQGTQIETTHKNPSNGNGGARTPQSGGDNPQESAAQTNRVTRQGSRALAATPRNPLGMMRQLSREMDRLMDSFFERGFGSLLREGGSREDNWQARTLWTPQIDVQQKDDAVIVRADLPGVSKEDVQVNVEGDTLAISGQRREEHEEGGDDQGYRLSERSYGSFYRTVPLPQGTNADGIAAKMRDGVLTVTLPLSAEARPRRITIQG